MTKTVTTIILVFTCSCLAGQHNARAPKWKFNSANQVGLLQGEAHSSASLLSVNGFRYGNFFSGVGTGIDYYRYRSIPLFGECRQYFGESLNQVYIYGNAGISFVWKERSNDLYGGKESYHPGFYGGAGIGYKVGLKNATGITLSVGYTYKKVTNVQQEIVGCPVSPTGPCIFAPETYRYHLSRLIFQFGFLF
jgi:hypothetical protein